MKVSDSGRLRNKLQTLCSQALEYTDDTIRLHFDRIDDEVILPEKKRVIREVFEWYKRNHPVWFSWLEILHFAARQPQSSVSGLELRRPNGAPEPGGGNRLSATWGRSGSLPEACAQCDNRALRGPNRKEAA